MESLLRRRRLHRDAASLRLYSQRNRCRLVAIIALALGSYASGQTATSKPGDNFQPVADLAQRVAPWLAPKLSIEHLSSAQDEGTFELETHQGRLIVRASDASSAAAGLNWYLKYYCHRSVSHLGNNMTPLTALPPIDHPVRQTTRYRYRYYLNYCTLNYTFAFADWPRWERELDWMALNGINLALATNGSEAVWQNTLRRVGYSDSEIFEFLPGPAYTAWWLMGNLEGWGGPVTQRMIDERVALEKKILGRMRELGIEPVLQGFYGMVPASLARKFPQAKIMQQGQWSSFRRPMILLSSDPLFARLSSIYYEEMKNLYCPVRFFGGDLFHEGGRTEGLDIAAIARGVQNSMLEANPQATWVLQGWQENPRDELLKGLQRDKILVLDLVGSSWEKREGYQASPWVWSIVNNFGENTGLYGDLSRIASEPVRAAASPYGRMNAGVGALMEGINNNPVVYDLQFEMAWHSQPVDVRQWIAEYEKYRYGETSPGLERAWQLLAENVYRADSGAQSIFCARPSLEVKGVSTWGSTQFGYDEAKLEEAARAFLGSADQLRNVDTYQVDAVDLVRQVLTNRALALYRQMVSAYGEHDKDSFDRAARGFLRLGHDLDTLLATRPEFMLGNWLAQSRAMGQSDTERALCEKNARTQITYWGPDDPKTDVHDYANKEWSGLLRDFYLVRWEMFVREMDARFEGKVASEVDYFTFERHWTEQRNEYPSASAGDAVETARAVLGHVSNP